MLVKDICSDPNCANLSFHSWYLDDGVVAGPSFAVQKVLALIEEKGPPLGLLVNHTLMTILGHTGVPPHPDDHTRAHRSPSHPEDHTRAHRSPSHPDDHTRAHRSPSTP